MPSFKEFEKQAWEAKAEGYDSTWGRVTRQVNASIIKQAALLPQMKYLDCGCGAGHLCFEMYSQGVKQVVGCDFSHAMLAIARENYPQLDFVFEDAEHLSFANASFDLISLNYLLLHVADQTQALREATRVLKSQGQLIYTVWLSPDRSPGLALMFEAIKKYADVSVIPAAQDIFMYSHPEQSRATLSQCGLTQISFQQIESYWEVGSADDFFTAVQAGTRMGGLIDLQSVEIKAKIKAHIDERIAAFRSNDSYIIPTPSLLVSAIKQ